MLRNTQGQNSVGYSGNLSDQAKKRTGIYQTASQPGIDTQAPRPQTGIAKAPQTGWASPSSNLQSPSVPGTVNIAGTQTQIPAQASGKSRGFNKGPAVVSPAPQQPATNITPGITPDKEKIGIKQPGNKIQLPDGWTKPNDGLMSSAVMVDWINTKTGERTSRTSGVAPPPGQGWETVKGGGGQLMSGDQLILPKPKVIPFPVQSEPGSFKDRWTQGGYGNLMQRPILSAHQPMTLRDAFSTLQTAGYGSF